MDRVRLLLPRTKIRDPFALRMCAHPGAGRRRPAARFQAPGRFFFWVPLPPFGFVVP